MNNDRYLALIGYEWRLKTPLQLAQEHRRQEREEWMAKFITGAPDPEEFGHDGAPLGERRPIDDDEIPF